MANLLYVTPDIIEKLYTHSAYTFWNPIMAMRPVRPIPLDERAFHPRQITTRDGRIYLTSDMKFVYRQDNLYSFLYVSQDLSFRLTSKNGILLTLDGKQFAAIVGEVAKVISESAVELVNTNKVFHPYFDTPLTASSASRSRLGSHSRGRTAANRSNPRYRYLRTRTAKKS